MKESSQKSFGKYAPIAVMLPFCLLIFLSTLVYGAGMRLGGMFLSAGGFVGVFIGTIAACNMCYRQGYAAGRHASVNKEHSAT